ncbi:hypothetical protein PENTCL1PPCAC_13135, partial [Pristionchus entomophagus]
GDVLKLVQKIEDKYQSARREAQECELRRRGAKENLKKEKKKVEGLEKKSAELTYQLENERRMAEKGKREKEKV